jgi:hypothetical protein
MGRVIYMDETIKMMGKKNSKKTQKLIDDNKVIYTSEEHPYLLLTEEPNEIRKTLDGTPLVELDEPMALIVNTKVPHKYILQDTETGEIYRGTTETTIGKQWEKILTINEDEKV